MSLNKPLNPHCFQPCVCEMGIIQCHSFSVLSFHPQNQQYFESFRGKLIHLSRLVIFKQIVFVFYISFRSSTHPPIAFCGLQGENRKIQFLISWLFFLFLGFSSTSWVFYFISVFSLTFCPVCKGRGTKLSASQEMNCLQLHTIICTAVPHSELI